MKLIAVNVIHFQFWVVQEVIVRELDAVKVTILKHQHVLSETSRGDEDKYKRSRKYYNIFRNSSHILYGYVDYQLQM